MAAKMEASTQCKYHPMQAANWHCQVCKVSFCNSCVVNPGEQDVPKCTLCRRTLLGLSLAEQIPPFWQKLGHLLSMPFSFTSLSVIFIFAFIYAVLPAGKVGALLFLISLIPLVEFLFVSMESLAAGETPEHKLSNYLSLKNKQFFLKFIITYSFSAFLIYKLYLISAIASYVITAFFILGLPASMIILMMEKSALEMLNPIKIVYIIKQFGRAYFLLYVMVLLAALIASSAAGLVTTNSDLIARMLLNGVGIYLTLTVFFMAGYLVYQYHRELNFSINRQSVFASVNTKAKGDLGEVNVFIQEGRFEDAQKLLLEKIKLNPMDYQANEKLILLYAVQNNHSYMNKIAQDYFVVLANKGKSKQAGDFYKKLVKKRIDFIPDNSTVVASISEALKNKSDFKLALSLLDAYLLKAKFPKDWELLYFLRAQLYVEYANQLPQAEKDVALILKRGLNQEVLDKADAYAKAFVIN